MRKGDAAHALGLSYWQARRKIILPQAITVAIPAIVSLTDLLLAMRQAIADPLWRRFFIEGYVFIALIYFVVCFFMSKYSQYLETQFRSEQQH